MNNQKFKILAIVDAVLIVVLIVVMMVLKGNYNDQAQASVKEQVGAYQENANGMLQEQWKSMDQYGMAWKLVYATLTGDKSEKSFDAAVKALDELFRLNHHKAVVFGSRQNAIYKYALFFVVAGLDPKLRLYHQGALAALSQLHFVKLDFVFAVRKI